MPHKEVSDLVKDLRACAEWFKEHGKNTNTAVVGMCERAAAYLEKKRTEKPTTLYYVEEHMLGNGLYIIASDRERAAEIYREKEGSKHILVDVIKLPCIFDN